MAKKQKIKKKPVKKHLKKTAKAKKVKIRNAKSKTISVASVNQNKRTIDSKRLLSLEEAEKYIYEAGGENGLKIFKYLIEKDVVEEGQLARKLGVEKINTIRKDLYKLFSKGLVAYIRKKRGKKAWYTYYWFANPDILILALKQEYQDEIDQIKKAVDLNKVEEYYICPICNRVYDAKTALENDFKCSNCGNILTHIDTEKVLETKLERIRELEKKIAFLDKFVHKSRPPSVKNTR
ncbi:hypothetical protein IHE50_01620 [Candidatus Parvarchaeota archaeon]|uniref:Transcription factor E n=1 Tax=Candidatus Acidifodinimicrobium mancum TaxID=2898728 RepID=A0A8T3UU69_9ARCH|nr:hypothetical protein [Candidatus Acidifodinimicrobium mancum]